MVGRVGFLAFLVGLLLGSWLGAGLRPKQLPVRVDCAPALQAL